MKPGLVIAAFFAVCAFALGFWGFSSVEGECTDYCFAHYLNIVWKTLALFVFETNLDTKTANVTSLAWARLLAPAATGLTLYELIAGYLAHRWSLYRLRNMRGHTIVIGNGQVGRSFIASCAAKESVAVIDLAGANRAVGSSSTKSKYSVRYFDGDARNAASLRNVAAQYAKRVFIVTGDDTVNLEILRSLLAMRAPRRVASSEPIDVLIRIGQQTLARQLEREDRFAQRASKAADQSPLRAAVVTPFAPARIAAQRFVAEHPLVDLADLRAQRRLHLVCVGWSEFTFEALEQIVRVSPYRDFDRPKVDLFARDPGAVRSHLEAVQHCILGGAGEPVIELHIHQLDDESGIPSIEQMRTVEPDGPAHVSAIIVSLASDENTAAAAIAIRERSAIEGRWGGPVFAHLSFDSALSDFLDEFTRQKDLAELVVPVGALGRCCTLDAIRGEREKSAIALHDAYVSHQRSASGFSEARGDNLQTWEQLRQTFRISNRRAVDHIPNKLLSAGYVFKTGRGLRLSKSDKLANNHQELEELAELEHRSWEIGRRLDGWKSGPIRDDKRRINPALDGAYRDLDEQIKELDREQVRTVATMLKDKSDGEVAHRDLPIGLIGHNRVSAEEKACMLDVIQSRLGNLIQNQPDRHFSILTPLAPGSDTILTEEALRILENAGVPHRLVVVQTLPREAVIADFVDTWNEGGEWRHAPRSADHPASTPAEILADHLDEVMSKASQTIVASLIPTGSHLGDWYENAQRRQDAYRCANAYLITRCDVMMAFHDRARPSRPGGTGEALAWALGATMPAACVNFVKGRHSPGPEVIELTSAMTTVKSSNPNSDEAEQTSLTN